MREVPADPTNHIRMKREDRDKWLAALRSGEYRQGYGRLQTVMPDGGTGYCCLGVLQMELSNRVEQDPLSKGPATYPSFGWLEEKGIMFTNEGGLPGCNPFLTKLSATADECNDEHGNTFLEIADAIEDTCEVYE